MSHLERLLFVSLIALCTSSVSAAPPRLARVEPSQIGMKAAVLNEIDPLITDTLEKKLFLGCVALVAHKGKIVFLKAYGQRQVMPTVEPMTVDSIFDMASVTKPVVTGTSVMLLAEQGKVELDTPIATYWPAFNLRDRDQITLRQLLTHQSGLSTGFHREPAKMKLVAAPEERFLYSCAGCITAGEVVHLVTGKSLADFAEKSIFRPLGMTSTSLGPVTAKQLERTVPTSPGSKGKFLRGVVNDFQARELNGIAGNAGMFSTAEDLAVFAQMMLNEGEYEGVRVLSRESVARMTTPHQIKTGEVRGIGWDMGNRLPNRASKYSDAAYGHGGWTGTSLWNDPKYSLTVILLTSRHHPATQGDQNRIATYAIAGKIGDIAIDAIQ